MPQQPHQRLRAVARRARGEDPGRAARLRLQKARGGPERAHQQPDGAQGQLHRNEIVNEGHQSGAQAISEWLEAQPQITKVIYPGLASHPQYDLAQNQMSNTSGMISFQVGNAAIGRKIAQQMIDRLKIVHYAVSLGHHRSLIFWMETQGLMDTSFNLSGTQLKSYRSYAGDGVFRMSVGLEDPEDLIRDLSVALS